jgi:transcriptional regulator with XRE-family HTH domain
VTGPVSPVVRGRRLAATLRRLRADSGRTVEDVALHLECSAAKVSRMENGLVGIRIQDARDLMDLYEVTGAKREQILALVRQARGRGWWVPFADVMPEGFDRMIGLEDEAAGVWMLQADLVPGLLQTERYARALMSSPADVPLDVVERRVQLRMERQRLLERQDPPALRILLDEAVLLRQVGGAEVMAEQYRRLVADARRPAVSLRVLPFSSATHQATGLSYIIFDFADPADPKVVYEELFSGSVLRESVELVGRYIAGFEHARGCALSEEKSLEELEHLAGQAC